MTLLKRISIASTSLVMLASLSTPVFAEGSSGSGSGSHDSTETTSTSGRTEATKPTSTEIETHSAGTDAQKKAAELKACENKKDVAEKAESRVAARGQNQINTFSKIAERVENFYQTKGYSVSNYDALVSDVNAKKVTAQAAVNTLKADSSSLSASACEGGHNKAKVGQFRTDLKNEKAAIKAYKTAINNLIVAVKSAKSNTGGAQ